MRGKSGYRTVNEHTKASNSLAKKTCSGRERERVRERESERESESVSERECE